MEVKSKNYRLLYAVCAVGTICYLVTASVVFKHIQTLDYWEYSSWVCDEWYAKEIDEAYKWIMGMVTLLSPASGVTGILIWGALGSIFFGEDSMKTRLMAGMIVCSVLFWGVVIGFGAFREEVLRLHPQASVWPALSHTVLTIVAFVVLAVDKSTRKTNA